MNEDQDDFKEEEIPGNPLRNSSALPNDDVDDFEVSDSTEEDEYADEDDDADEDEEYRENE